MNPGQAPNTGPEGEDFGGKDLREWHPAENRPAYGDEGHAPAEITAGADGQWRLCAECAKLDHFNRYKSRKRIK
jgi:hypothetical protein